VADIRERYTNILATLQMQAEACRPDAAIEVNMKEFGYGG
jgi:hypothetical protein